MQKQTCGLWKMQPLPPNHPSPLTNPEILGFANTKIEDMPDFRCPPPVGVLRVKARHESLGR